MHSRQVETQSARLDEQRIQRQDAEDEIRKLERKLGAKREDKGKLDAGRLVRGFSLHSSFAMNLKVCHLRSKRHVDAVAERESLVHELSGRHNIKGFEQ